jgi:hypothetical protein
MTTMTSEIDRWRDRFNVANQRIQQLEKLNATLAAEVDRMRPVVDAAVEWRRDGYERKADFCVGINPLLDAIDIYDVGIKRPW